MTKLQKRKWYAGGRPTAEKTSIYDKEKKEFRTVWLSRLRGRYVGFRKDPYHDTKESAIEDAKKFRDAMTTPLKSP